MSLMSWQAPVHRALRMSPKWCLPAGFLDRLRIELRLQGQLQSLGLKPGLVQQLLKTRATSNAEVNELRLDLSPMKQVGDV